MRAFLRAVAAVAIGVVALAVTPAAQAQPTFTFDEFGVGNDPGGAPLPSGVAPDPVSGIPTLFYLLPFAPTPGDLLIFEPGAPNDPSDVLRFFQNRVWVFSDATPGDPNPGPADVGLPPNFQPNLFQVIETGNEGFNFVNWVPTPNQPGGGFGVQYTFYSDVPAPAGAALAGCGLLVIARRRRRG